MIRYWKKGMVWDLRKPSQVVECFYFLCSLKEHIDKQVEEDMTTIETKARNGQFDLDMLKERSGNWVKAKERGPFASQFEDSDESESENMSEGS